MSHTPLPWNFEPDQVPRPFRREHALRIYAEDPGPDRDFHIGYVVSVDKKTREDNAKLLRDAVNNYERLLAENADLRAEIGRLRAAFW